MPIPSPLSHSDEFISIGELDETWITGPRQAVLTIEQLVGVLGVSRVQFTHGYKEAELLEIAYGCTTPCLRTWRQLQAIIKDFAPDVPLGAVEPASYLDHVKCTVLPLANLLNVVCALDDVETWQTTLPLMEAVNPKLALWLEAGSALTRSIGKAPDSIGNLQVYCGWAHDTIRGIHPGLLPKRPVCESEVYTAVYIDEIRTNPRGSGRAMDRGMAALVSAFSRTPIFDGDALAMTPGPFSRDSRNTDGSSDRGAVNDRRSDHTDSSRWGDASQAVVSLSAADVDADRAAAYSEVAAWAGVGRFALGIALKIGRSVLVKRIESSGQRHGAERAEKQKAEAAKAAQSEARATAEEARRASQEAAQARREREMAERQEERTLWNRTACVSPHAEDHARAPTNPDEIAAELSVRLDWITKRAPPESTGNISMFIAAMELRVSSLINFRDDEATLPKDPGQIMAIIQTRIDQLTNPGRVGG